MDLRALKSASAAVLLLLVACGGPEPADTESTGTPQSTPVAVSYDQLGVASDQAPVARDLANPFNNDPNAARQGETLFGAMNCDGCHGGGAVGFVGPSLVDGRWRYGADDAALFSSIFYGRANGMPAYGAILAEGTVWQLVSYLRSQPVPGVVPTMAWQ